MGAGTNCNCTGRNYRASPDYGLVRPRSDFDQILANQAVKAGAHLRERTNVTGLILDERSGWILGSAKPVDERGRQSGDEVLYRSRLVIAADGNSDAL